MQKKKKINASEIECHWFNLFGITQLISIQKAAKKVDS